MSWPRGSLFAALLVLSIPLASADTITVDTTTDDYADNSLCSLREAVEYFNLDKPVDGFQGCKPSATSGADTISIPADESPYLIGADRGAIFIRRSLTLTGGGMQGADKSVLKVEGAHRAFVISSVRTIADPACYASSTCSPAGAPVLDPASDTSSGHYLTTTTTPTFKGTVTGMALPLTVRVQVRLYDKPAWAPSDAEPVMIGSADADTTTGEWAIVAESDLAEGMHNISFTLTASSDDDDESEEGDQSPVTQLGIRAADDPALTITFSQMEIQGCNIEGSLTDCANAVDGTVTTTSANGLVYSYPLTGTAGKGGIFYSDETLGMTSVNIHDGIASSQGGAVYAASHSVTTFMTSRLAGNKAASGGAIYAEKNAVIISKSVLTDNTASAGAIVQVASADLVDGSTDATTVSDSTISGNHGLALSFRKGALVSGSTIVLNDAGLDFNGEKVSVYASILAGNPDKFPAAATPTDCQNLPATADIDFRFSLGFLGGGCDDAPSGLTFLRNGDVSVPEEKLMASVELVQVDGEEKKKCVGFNDANYPAFKGMGLLCPLMTRSVDDATEYHMPRLLGAYSEKSDSPIVGKGSDISVSVCSASDQRAKNRHSICDIGAVEIQPVVESVRSGDAISYGDTHTEALDSELEDEELFVPTALNGSGSCPDFAPTLAEDKLKPGCPWITSPPTKGTVVFNNDGTYTYTPGSDFHGYDRFSFRVVTTLSKLMNSTDDSQSRLVDAQIIVEPRHGISSYSTAGVADLWELLLLMGLGGVVGLGRRGQK